MKRKSAIKVNFPVSYTKSKNLRTGFLISTLCFNPATVHNLNLLCLDSEQTWKFLLLSLFPHSLHRCTAWRSLYTYSHEYSHTTIILYSCRALCNYIMRKVIQGERLPGLSIEITSAIINCTWFTVNCEFLTGYLTSLHFSFLTYKMGSIGLLGPP